MTFPSVDQRLFPELIFYIEKKVSQRTVIQAFLPHACLSAPGRRWSLLRGCANRLAGSQESVIPATCEHQVVSL